MATVLDRPTEDPGQHGERVDAHAGRAPRGPRGTRPRSASPARWLAVLVLGFMVGAALVLLTDSDPSVPSVVSTPAGGGGGGANATSDAAAASAGERRRHRRERSARPRSEGTGHRGRGAARRAARRPDARVARPAAHHGTRRTRCSTPPSPTRRPRATGSAGGFAPGSGAHYVGWPDDGRRPVRPERGAIADLRRHQPHVEDRRAHVLRAWAKAHPRASPDRTTTGTATAACASSRRKRHRGAVPGRRRRHRGPVLRPRAASSCRSPATWCTRGSCPGGRARRACSRTRTPTCAAPTAPTTPPPTGCARAPDRRPSNSRVHQIRRSCAPSRARRSCSCRSSGVTTGVSAGRWSRTSANGTFLMVGVRVLAGQVPAHLDDAPRVVGLVEPVRHAGVEVAR